MGRRKCIENKEETAEDFCFICKDGGRLRICDFRNCLKAYHPQCVDKDQSFMETEEQWFCGWHSCFICHKVSAIQCHCCPTSVCRNCIKVAEFVQVKKRTKGFCNNCLKLAILAEENADVDSDGGKVDFHDKETLEFLFKDYWELIKDKVGVTLVDLHAADTLLKRGKSHHSESDSDKFVEEDVMSDVDDSCDDQVSPLRGSRNKHSGRKTPSKRYRTRKKAYLGWGSEELIGFLCSIGKDTTELLSQLDISDIIKDYIQTNNLFDPDKKKKKIVLCDERLRALFRKTRVRTYKIYSLLESHLAENADLSEEFSFSSEEGSKQVSSKKHRRVNSDSKVKSELNSYKRKILEQPKIYAAIVWKNINSLYLRKSLILKFLKDPESFEGKVTGCFVRVKNNPNDFYNLPYKLYQLGRVEGIKKNPQAYKIGDMSTDVILCIGNMKDIHISKLSDDDFEEEECDDLHQLVKKGLLKRPTIAELHKKIKIMHKDIMSHWIDRETLRLQKLIERANEKGWRAELFEYIEKRELLRKPAERIRLLEELPNVIEDMEDNMVATASIPIDLHGVHSTPLGFPLKEIEGVHAATMEASLDKVEGSEDPLVEPVAEGLEGSEASSSFGHLTPDGSAVRLEALSWQNEDGRADSMEALSRQNEGNGADSDEIAGEDVEGIEASLSVLAQVFLDIERDKPLEANEISINKVGIDVEANGVHLKDTIASNTERHKPLEANEININKMDIEIEANGVHLKDSIASHTERHKPLEANDININRMGIEIEANGVHSKETIASNTERHKPLEANEININKMGIEVEANGVHLKDKIVSSIEIIDLDNDEDDGTGPSISLRETGPSRINTSNEDDEAANIGLRRLWHYRDSCGQVQGPFSEAAFRNWHAGGFFDASFEVWRTGNSPNEAILLTDLLGLPSS